MILSGAQWKKTGTHFIRSCSFNGSTSWESLQKNGSILVRLQILRLLRSAVEKLTNLWNFGAGVSWFCWCFFNSYVRFCGVWLDFVAGNQTRSFDWWIFTIKEELKYNWYIFACRSTLKMHLRIFVAGKNPSIQFGTSWCSLVCFAV